MKRVLTGILAVLALGGPAVLAQPSRPSAQVTTVADLKNVTARGGVARLSMRVVFPAGLHVQANKPRDPALIPTVLSVTVPKGSSLVDVVYPKAVDLIQAGASQPLAVYPNVFDIVVRVKVPAGTAPGTVVIPATLRYQACNEALCFPPSRVETRWTLTFPKA